MFFKPFDHIQLNKNNERGNVLFLILIAVALFAALSYAVTSSSRSGGGDINDEKNLVSSASIIQYPASVQAAITRMRITNNIAVEDLEFYPPSDFASCTTVEQCVFHPQGGGATWINAPAEVMTGTGNNPTGRWYYSGFYEINNVGTSVTSSGDGNDIVMFLIGVSEAVCKKINEEAGLDENLTKVAEAGYSEEIISDTSFAFRASNGDPYIPNSTETIISNAVFGGHDIVDGSYNACYREDEENEHVFYSVLIAR